MKMKFGKLFSVLALSGALVSTALPSNAFAADGFLDTKSSALEFIGTYSEKINDITDVEWYKWTNYSSTSKSISVSVQGSGNAVDLALIFDLHQSNGLIYYSPYINNQPGGGTEAFSISLSPGETIYYRVSGHNGTYSNSDYYFVTATPQ